jgi:hypothetical protein
MQKTDELSRVSGTASLQITLQNLNNLTGDAIGIWDKRNDHLRVIAITTLWRWGTTPNNCSDLLVNTQKVGHLFRCEDSIEEAQISVFLSTTVHLQSGQQSRQIWTKRERKKSIQLGLLHESTCVHIAQSIKLISNGLSIWSLAHFAWKKIIKSGRKQAQTFMG